MTTQASKRPAKLKGFDVYPQGVGPRNLDSPPACQDLLFLEIQFLKFDKNLARLKTYLLVVRRLTLKKTLSPSSWRGRRLLIAA